MARKTRDTRTLDLFTVRFEIPEEPRATTGALDLSGQVRASITEVLRGSRLSRHQIADGMTDLTGRPITVHNLNAWASPSHHGHRFPLEYAPALEAVTGTYDLTRLIARKRGCAVLRGKEVLLAELGDIERQERELARRKHAVLDHLGTEGDAHK